MIRLSAFWVSGFLALLCLPACEPNSGSEAETLPGINAARAAFWEAHEQGDAQAFAALVTEDAVLWAPGMEEVRGRPAILKAAEGMFTAMDISHFEIESMEVDIHGNLAYELATYSETVTYEGAEPTSARGRYLIVWRKDADGHWRAHRNMFHFIAGP